MAIELPPWLTRQYDYASGIRQTGQQIAENLQRNKQLETAAIHAAAQAEQARALESWRLAQAQALQEKTRMEQERETKDAEALSNISNDLNELPNDAPLNHRRGVVLKYGKDLHPMRFKALWDSLDKEASLEGKKEIFGQGEAGKNERVGILEEGRNKRLDKTLQNKLDIKEMEFGTKGEEGESQWDTKTFPSGHVGIRLRGSKTWKLIKPDDLNDVEKITLLDLNKSIRDLQNALNKIPVNSDGTIPPDRASILKQLRNLQGDKASFLERRAEGKEPETKQETPKKTKSGKDIPEGYIRVRIKATGQTAWADPETAKSAEFEIIEEE